MRHRQTPRLAPILCALALLAACAARSSGPQPAADTLVDVQLLALNDFHGALEPPTGSNGRMGGVDAGGVEFLATHLARLRATNPHTLTVAAGDNIGASALLSGMFHDEPAIEALGAAGLDVSTVGNHEFDEGWDELYRIQHGGCHPVDGCQDGTPFAGAPFEILAANVTIDPARVGADALTRSGWTPKPGGAQALLPAYTIREIGGVRIGFIGLVLRGTAEIVPKPGIRGLSFLPEVQAGNDAVAALTRQGVRAIVVLIHEGGQPATSDPNGCGVTGPIVPITRGLSDEVDVVVSGHSHRSYVCTVGNTLLTSAESLGRLVTKIDLQIDRRTGDVVAKRANNVIVTRDVPRDPAQTRLLDHYRPSYHAAADRIVGTVSAPLTRATLPSGESAYGDIVADAFLDAGRRVDARAVAALVNPGGLRGDLSGDDPADDGVPRTVRYVEAFDSLPFGNRVAVRTISGDALARMLEEQFDNPDPGARKILQVSSGFTYAYDSLKPAGQRVDRSTIRVAGKPLDLSHGYRIVSSDFIWSGGDEFSTASEGTDPVDAGADVDALLAYLGAHSPVAPGRRDRMRGR
ncbi:MAG: bifunctional UDP-sugar hydrolase/5'-nucleotidase [Vicinamibacterales bacterium]